MTITDYIYLLILTVIHLYLWVLMFRKILYQPKDWISIFLVVLAFVVVRKILNVVFKDIPLPIFLVIIVNLIYIAIGWRVYYVYKKQKNIQI